MDLDKVIYGLFVLVMLGFGVMHYALRVPPAPAHLNVKPLPSKAERLKARETAEIRRSEAADAFVGACLDWVDDLRLGSVPSHPDYRFKSPHGQGCRCIADRFLLSNMKRTEIVFAGETMPMFMLGRKSIQSRMKKRDKRMKSVWNHFMTNGSKIETSTPQRLKSVLSKARRSCTNGPLILDNEDW